MKTIRALSDKASHALLLAAALLFSSTLSAQALYPAPGEAADALVDAVAISDDQALARVLGRDYRSLLPDGLSQDDIYDFLSAAAHDRSLVEGPGQSVLFSVGPNGWTFPIPIARRSKGWQFDLSAGRKEIARRTIGRNELAAIEVLAQLADAQKEYGARGVAQGYAHKLVSTSGKTDGLYWPQQDGQPSSPVGPAALSMLADTPASDAFYGYHFRIVPVSSLRYAIYAWPAQPGKTGAHEFVYLSSGELLERIADGRHVTDPQLGTLFDGPKGGWQEVML